MVDFGCDGGDCFDCNGVCGGGATQQFNDNGLLCGCDSDVLVGANGCCLNGVDNGEKDCAGNCSGSAEIDCAGCCSEQIINQEVLGCELL
jgi:hypothetical protein